MQPDSWRILVWRWLFSLVEHTHTHTHLYYCTCESLCQYIPNLDGFPLLLIPGLTFDSRKYRKPRTGTHSNSPPPWSAPLLHSKLCTLSFGTIINKRSGEQKTCWNLVQGNSVVSWLWRVEGGAHIHQCNSKCHADLGQACHIHLSDPYGWSN